MKTEKEIRTEANEITKKEMKKLTEKFIKEMNAKLSGSIMKLKKWSDSEGAFQIIYDLKNDPFINNEYHKNGNAYIYPNNAFYTLLEDSVKEINLEINWNNTKGIGSFDYFALYERILEKMKTEKISSGVKRSIVKLNRKAIG